jgi:hypothetical protein
VAELLAIDLITVAQEVGWRGVVRERGDDLLRGPNSGGVPGLGLRRRLSTAWRGC